ncbi:HNH endonuclease [Cytobacillus solani]|uniref:HNH endonuclease n=1 Tax=Cytobacillus solani TaxID=1637975 RepID=UPI0006FFE651|nr:HNH endonuclease [Cytobacillus solani]
MPSNFHCNGMKKETYVFIRDNLHKLELDLENGKVLNRNVNALNKGYLRMKLAGKRVFQHQVLAVARWGEKCIGMTVNHINENKIDNSWNNLELLSHADNVRVMTTHGNHLRQPIKAIRIETNEEIVFESQREAARKLSLSQAHISSILYGKRRSTGGYKFERVV